MSLSLDDSQNPRLVRPQSVEEVQRWCRDLATAPVGWPIPGLPEIDFAAHVPPMERARSAVWGYGETLRQCFVDHPSWINSAQVQEGLKSVVDRREWGRGRESFVTLFGRKTLVGHADWLASHLADPGINGHVVKALSVMRSVAHAELVRPFLTDKRAWVRRSAKRCVELTVNGNE